MVTDVCSNCGTKKEIFGYVYGESEAEFLPLCEDCTQKLIDEVIVMVRDKCFNCGKDEVNGYVGSRHIPLCTECLGLVINNGLTLEELEEKLQKEKK